MGKAKTKTARTTSLLHESVH